MTIPTVMFPCNKFESKRIFLLPHSSTARTAGPSAAYRILTATRTPPKLKHVYDTDDQRTERSGEGKGSRIMRYAKKRRDIDIATVKHRL